MGLYNWITPSCLTQDSTRAMRRTSPATHQKTSTYKSYVSCQRTMGVTVRHRNVINTMSPDAETKAKTKTHIQQIRFSTSNFEYFTCSGYLKLTRVWTFWQNKDKRQQVATANFYKYQCMYRWFIILYCVLHLQNTSLTKVHSMLGPRPILCAWKPKPRSRPDTPRPRPRPQPPTSGFERV